MKKKIPAIFMLLALSLTFCQCGEDEDQLTGNEVMEDLRAESNAMPADGITGLDLVATILDTSGAPLPGALVQFSTTAGAITPKAYSDQYGEAIARITSAASETDIEATITARIIPDEEGRRAGYFLGIAPKNKDGSVAYALQKSTDDPASEARVIIWFTGITFTAQLDKSTLCADGISTTQLRVTVRESSSKKGISGAQVQLRGKTIPILQDERTDSKGSALITITSPTLAGTDTLFAEYGNLFRRVMVMSFVPPRLSLLPDRAELLADGLSTLSLSAVLVSPENNPVSGAEIQFICSQGVVTSAATTSSSGEAIATFRSSSTPARGVKVIARFHEWADTTLIDLVDNTPATLQLSVNSNFIWVTGTGHTDQCIVTASVLGANGKPFQEELGVRFVLRNGPDGGEALLPNDGNPLESTVQRSIAGSASIVCKAGTRSGTVEILAQLVDYPAIVTRSTQITMRSGPPYIWIDPADPNHVESHMTVALNCFNLDGWNNVREFQVSVYVGDKYNNPVEEGTTLYLTCTAGIVTTSTRTDAQGRGTATWITANPRPAIAPSDPTTLAPHRVPNPNAPGMVLNVTMPDFEGSLVRNSSGSLTENDGIGLVMCSTQGRDQAGHDAVVYALNEAVFSGPVLVFTAEAVKSSLDPGESTSIMIRLYDLNGNPVARGSTLTASATAGKLSSTDLMAKPEMYGFGETAFIVSLANDLDPDQDKSVTSEVTFRLESPNGTGTRTVRIFLRGKE